MNAAPEKNISDAPFMQKFFRRRVHFFFPDPQLVIIDALYLETLSEKEYKSGYAEMLKHGIIQDKDYFEELSQ